MSNTEARKGTGPPGFALVMESDVDLRATICSALLLDGHRVESTPDCAGVLAWRSSIGPLPDEFLLALGGRDGDPNWETLRVALDEDVVLSRAAVIVLLTVRNGLKFPVRARFFQKPFAMEKLLALVSSDVVTARRRPV